MSTTGQYNDIHCSCSTKQVSMLILLHEDIHNATPYNAFDFSKQLENTLNKTMKCETKWECNKKENPNNRPKKNLK